LASISKYKKPVALMEKLVKNMGSAKELLNNRVPIQGEDNSPVAKDHTGFGQFNAALPALSYKAAKVGTQDDLEQFIHHQLKGFLPGCHIQIYRTGDNGKNYYFHVDQLSANRDPTGPHIIEANVLRPDHAWINPTGLFQQHILVQPDEVTGTDRTSVWLTDNFRRGITKAMFLLLGTHENITGLMVVFFTGKVDTAYLNQAQAISWQISVAINNIIAYENIADQYKELDKYKQQLEIESNYIHEEIENTFNYGDIIGVSEAMKKVFFLVSQVAEAQSSVLILGETGTGKELIARALHNASPRRKKLMVKINCAALPANLIESELFGHEKGSFTGASERRIGKFELANNSTLFLDEVGELPLELQVKLLRALQEKEIERIGGSDVIKVNVRIVAATNRDLLKEVHSGNFRSDLYFRLNVFPIMLPPLRDRKDDIPLLATHFLEKQTKKTMARITGFSAKVMKQLRAYDWPGNVRELEHLIERSILLTNGTIINQVPILFAGTGQTVEIPDNRIKTIDEIEREHIISVLKKCNNKVSGIGGAADVLKIPPSTLNSKMRRLKIKRAYNKT
jgi:formate hydrogenlyase transcriptional activator